ncbi:MAG: hypothetical protein ACRESZ_21595 [Methylococcales bacterium]
MRVRLWLSAIPSPLQSLILHQLLELVFNFNLVDVHGQVKNCHSKHAHPTSDRKSKQYIKPGHSDYLIALFTIIPEPGLASAGILFKFAGDVARIGRPRFVPAAATR